MEKSVKEIVAEIKEKMDKLGGLKHVYFVACGGSKAAIFPVGITAGHCAGMTVAALIDNRFSFDRSLADYELNSLEEIVPLAEKIRDLK